MSSKRRPADEFAVGLTVIAAIIVLIGGVLWGKGVSFRSDHRTFNVLFPEVYGLKEGSTVLIQGVAHGKVGGIQLDGRGATVTVLVDRNVRLYKDARVILFTPQLMGGRVVSIDPGNGPEVLKDNAVLQGEVPAGMGEVMAASGEVLEELLKTVQQLHTTTARVDTLLVQSQLTQRVEKSLTNLEQMTLNLRDDLSAAAKSMRDGADEVHSSTKEIHSLVADNKPRFDSLMVRLNRVVDETEDFSRNLGEFSNAMNQQEGSLGKLVYSDSLHQQLQMTLTDLDALIVRLKKEGIKVSIF
ncbi:MAG: MlaD family protein [bacterium]